MLRLEWLAVLCGHGRLGENMGNGSRVFRAFGGASRGSQDRPRRANQAAAPSAFFSWSMPTANAEA